LSGHAQNKGVVIDIPFEEGSIAINEEDEKNITDFFEGKDLNRQLLYIDLYARSTFSDGSVDIKYIAQKRVKAVKDLLKSLGVPDRKIHININSNISGNLEEIPKHRNVEMTYIPKLRHIDSDLEAALSEDGEISTSSTKEGFGTKEEIKNRMTAFNEADTFQINNHRDTMVVNSNGVGFHIPAYAFIGVTQTRPNVNFVTKAIISREALLFENITTATMNGDVLETAAVINLTAFSKYKKSMRINPKNPIVMFVPSEAPSKKMNFYLGISDEKQEILWTRRRTPFFITESDTITNCLPCYSKKSFSKCSPYCNPEKLKKDGVFKEAYSKYYTRRDSKKKYNKNYDCAECKAFNYLREQMKTTPQKEIRTPADFANGNIFRTNRTGWNNIEKKQDSYHGGVNLVVSDDTKEENEDIFIKLIFDNINTVFSNPTLHSSNVFEFKNIPSNANAHIIAIKEIDGKPYVAVESLLTGIDGQIDLNYRSFANYEGIKAYLDSKTNPTSELFVADDY